MFARIAPVQFQALWETIQQVASSGETDVTLGSATPGAVMRSQRLLHVPFGASVTREQLVGPVEVRDREDTVNKVRE